MANSDVKKHIESLKRNPDGAAYKVLLHYLELRIEHCKDLLIKETDMDEVKRIQGRAMEIRDMLSGLTRKPVVNKFDGAYGQ